MKVKLSDEVIENELYRNVSLECGKRCFNYTASEEITSGE